MEGGIRKLCPVNRTEMKVKEVSEEAVSQSKTHKLCATEDSIKREVPETHTLRTGQCRR